MFTMWWILFAHALLLVFCTPGQGRVLGVQNQHIAYFKAAEEVGRFRCLDNSTTIPFSRVNNDVCDCVDGSDEPGTSGCTVLLGSLAPVLPVNWSFQCTDQEHHVQTIPHNRVGDGICDCCDGSDEAASLVVCPNRCAEVAAEIERQREVDRERRIQAVGNKELMRSDALRRREESAKSLPGLEEEHAKIVANISALEKKKAAASAVQEREAEGEVSLEEKKADNEEGELADKTGSCLQWRQTAWCTPTGPHENYTDKPCTSVIEESSSGYCLCRAGVKNDELAGGAEEDTEHEEESENMVVRSETVRHSFSCGHPVFTCMHVCDHNGEVGVSKVDEDLEDRSSFIWDDIEESLVEAKERLEKLEKTIESAKKSQTSSITTEDLLRTLEKREFTIEFHEQTYAVVMFDKIYQRDLHAEEGGTLLGSWKSMGENTYAMWAKDAYDLSRMIYDDGLMCWNGVRRNVELRLVCGPENKLVQVEEPSMCNYRMLFETPALCDD
ncbi:hypothetical protein JKF63_04125 [Porcisia hertigi]|uniref:Glucosidase 2 subunit beta n=1 Tax=Porcisia hertigi TaxID=2761500 RepID=A0A836IDT1_9TRYP|nr:hypothetical protein JKF63_04125 [Porcisia hertigi]